jgi:hypothetical protein
MHLWFPDLRALCAAENATHVQHDILTVRGAVVRDARRWASYLTETISLRGDELDVVFASHQWSSAPGRRQAPARRPLAPTGPVGPDPTLFGRTQDSRSGGQAGASLHPNETAASEDLRAADGPREDSCFALAEQASEEAGPARLVLVRSASLGLADRHARFRAKAEPRRARAQCLPRSPSPRMHAHVSLRVPSHRGVS